MIYSFVDFLRANDMLPPEWQNVFIDPATTIDQFLKAFVPHIQPHPQYISEVGQQIMELEEEYGPDNEEGSPGPSAKKPDLQVIDSPTPPASPDEEEGGDNGEAEEGSSEEEAQAEESEPTPPAPTEESEPTQPPATE
jgi:hypothetical protein